MFRDICNGEEFYFIRLANGNILAPSIVSGLGFQPQDNQPVKFDYVIPDFLFACNQAVTTVEITCIEAIPQQGIDPIFETFPWLTVSQTNCTTEKITIYQSGAFQFLFLETPTGDSLFLETGQFYCETTPTYDCVNAYRLTEIVDTWECGDAGPSTIDNDNDGILADLDPNDNDPCIPNPVGDICNPTPDCSRFTGTMILALCAREPFFYISLADGTTLAPLIADGLGYEPQNGDQVRFDYIIPDFLFTCNLDAQTVEITCIEAVPTVPTINDPLFDSFPWLNVSQTNCTTEQITVYQSGAFQFLFVETPTGDSLFLETGQFYCASTPTYDCVNAYRLTEIVDTWTCGDSGTTVTDNDNDGFSSNEDPDDNDPCVPVAQASDCMQEPNCDNYTGTIFFENCDDGSIFYFIRLANGEIFDPYLADGIEFDPKEGQIVKFDFVIPDFVSPCSITDETVEITCIEEVPQVVDDPIFAEFPWLAAKVQPTTCTEGQVTVYQSGAFKFVFIEQATGDSLFFQTGQYYCETTPTYDCVAAYNLSAIVDTWTCAQSNAIINDDTRTKPQLSVRQAIPTSLAFKAFPNPTSGDLTIQSNSLQLDTPAQLSVFNQLGNLLIQVPIANGNQALNIAHLPQGVYYLVLEQGMEKVYERVVKGK